MQWPSAPHTVISLLYATLKEGKLESVSLIHSCTTLHFMAYQPEIPLSDLSVTGWPCVMACLLLGCFHLRHLHIHAAISHQLGTFILFASSTCPIILQRPLFVLPKLYIRTTT